MAHNFTTKVATDKQISYFETKTAFYSHQNLMNYVAVTAES